MLNIPHPSAILSITGKLRIQLIAAFLFALIFNAPRFLQVSITLNMTKSNHTFLGESDKNTVEHIIVYPANTKHLYNIWTMLDQCRKRWADVIQMLYKCFVFVGYNSIQTDLF